MPFARRHRVRTPWLPQQTNPGDLARYVPMQDGAAALTVRYDANDEPIAWQATNTRVLAPIALAGNASRFFDGIEKLYRADNASPLSVSELLARIANARIVEIHQRTLVRDGELAGLVSIYIRDPRGDFAVGIYSPRDANDLAYTPPALDTPGNLAVGSSWETTGTLGVANYVWDGRVGKIEPLQTALGAFQDCVMTDNQFKWMAGENESAFAWQSHLCAGAGAVETKNFDANGAPTDRAVVVSSAQFAPRGIKNSRTGRKAVSSSRFNSIIVSSLQRRYPRRLTQRILQNLFQRPRAFFVATRVTFR